MKSDNLPFSVMASLLLGAVQFLALNYFWTVMTLYVQHVPWLLAHGITGTSLGVSLLFFDSTVNLALCLPAAFVLCALRPQRIALYLALAVLPAFLWQYRLFLTNPTLWDNWAIFVPGALAAALTLPVAVLLAMWLAPRRAA